MKAQWVRFRTINNTGVETKEYIGCSNCHGSVPFNSQGDYDFTEFCPSCGAEMEPLIGFEVKLQKNVCPCCGRRLPREEKDHKWVQLSIFDEEKKDEL